MSERKTGLKLLFLIIYFLFYAVYLYWRGFYTLPLQFGLLSIIFGTWLFLGELVGFFETAIFYTTIWKTETPATPEVREKEYPEVDVFITTYNEPPELIYKTLIACKNMRYPQKERVHIYLCDDGHRKSMYDLCEKLQVGYITRRDNKHAKAGNLNNALSLTGSPYFVTFDADMMPQSSFLMKTIPFFMTGEKVGFVQVPQNFYNNDAFQYNLFVENCVPNEQDLFSRLIQAGKSRFNAVIYSGSNTVISRKAVEEVGGLAADTITEDFATGMKIQSAGYKSYYLNEILASGLAPSTLEDMYNQRIRWGRGVVQTFKKYKPLTRKGLSLAQRLMYFSAYSYWYFGIWRFMFLLAPILYSLFSVVVLYASPLQALYIWLPMFLLTKAAYRFFTKNLRTTTWSHVYDTLLFPQVTAGILLETFGVKMLRFKVTPKDSVVRNEYANKFRLVSVQIVLALLSLGGIIRMGYLCFTGFYQTAFLINFFWLFYNLYLLIMAIFFASERPKYRSSERLAITATASIDVDGNKHWGSTQNISENGISVLFEEPFYIDPDKMYELQIYDGEYCVKCRAEIIRVENIKKTYMYSFHFFIDEPNYNQLVCLLFDRVPEAPRVTTYRSMLENIRKNLSSRSKNEILLNRKLPRIAVRKELKARLDSGLELVFLEDYNYNYCCVKSKKQYPELKIILNERENLVLDCELKKELCGNGRCVYYIRNYRELILTDTGLNEELKRLCAAK